MPISGPNSYPSTMSEFVQHWTDLNTVLGTPVVLAGSRTLVVFNGWLEQVAGKITETNAAVMAAALRKGELDSLKASLIAWTVIFNATVRADYKTHSLSKNLVTAPGQSDGRGIFLEPAAKTQQIWSDLNAVTGTDVEIKQRRTLPNGTIETVMLGFDGYVELLNNVQGKWNEWDRARQKVENVRETRNDVMTLAYDTMRDYRSKVPLELPAGHALDSLPLLNPDPSQKPDAPEASGSWNEATAQADLTAVPSTSPTVVRHDLRWSPGEGDYDEENEVTLTTLPAGEALTFSTDIGLTLTGNVSRFTWVAVTGNGHEARSNVVAVTRA
jgi:hypothetical protein